MTLKDYVDSYSKEFRKIDAEYSPDMALKKKKDILKAIHNEGDPTQITAITIASLTA